MVFIWFDAANIISDIKIKFWVEFQDGCRRPYWILLKSEHNPNGGEIQYVDYLASLYTYKKVIYWLLNIALYLYLM